MRKLLKEWEIVKKEREKEGKRKGRKEKRKGREKLSGISKGERREKGEKK